MSNKSNYEQERDGLTVRFKLHPKYAALLSMLAERVEATPSELARTILIDQIELVFRKAREQIAAEQQKETADAGNEISGTETTADQAPVTTAELDPDGVPTRTDSGSEGIPSDPPGVVQAGVEGSEAGSPT